MPGMENTLDDAAINADEDSIDEDDEEDDEEYEDVTRCKSTENNEEKTAERNAKWNMFRKVHQQEESTSMADTTCIDLTISIVKLLAYLITFCGVLFFGVGSKWITLLMTSQLAPERDVLVARGTSVLLLKISEEEKYLWIWALMISYTIPEIYTFLRSVRYMVFKGHTRKEKVDVGDNLAVFVILSFETLHVTGMSILTFAVLPEMDAVRGAMLTNCVCLVPAVLSAMSSSWTERSQRIVMSANVISILMQLTGYILWPVTEGNPKLATLPVALFLVSFGWWMNFVSGDSNFGIVQLLHKIAEELRENHIFLYKRCLWMSLYKIVLFVVTSFVVLAAQGVDLSRFFQNIDYTFSSSRLMNASRLEQVHGNPQFYLVTNSQYTVRSIGDGVWKIILTQAACSYLAYASSVFACKIMISTFSFSLPSVLIVPTTVTSIFAFIKYRKSNLSSFNEYEFSYLTFNQVLEEGDVFGEQLGWIWLFWLLSQVWISRQIWFPKCDRLSRSDKLFTPPLYCGFLVEQSTVMNRRRDTSDGEYERLREEKEQTKAYPPHIIACATMWHENRQEMLEMLKSVIRMDQDQCMRQSIRETFKRCDDDNLYTYETHIFFDDAFEIEDEETENVIVNSFVRDLMETVDKAVEAVYEVGNLKIAKPKKMATPYGGRLTYTLPGHTMLYVHLKDKDKIRHRKRWSQVMYMYYLLGYNLMEKENLTIDQKLKKAENTFLLALDGDIDFKPQAVLLLLDLMKKNTNLGAACGRIHPLGSGFMVWYQNFEYAIGHWLQKSTEHVIGCVLCSPGCFSLFRGRALMDDNVMRSYTTKAEEAQHYVQYDQGEDRWLCTLLLQRGYRVEYSAASDAYTHCPESFSEFYTQRRRWIPSTMANILDLLRDGSHITQINNDISRMYIAYQGMLMIGTVLGPGTIFMLLVSAFNTAFKIDNWTSFYFNMIPILLYVIICRFASGNVQLNSALIISGMYGLVMMAVLVGMLVQIQDDGIQAPSTIFLFIVAGEIIVAGLIHPMEVRCLIYGPIYYVTIPSMYLLLIIYSVCNLNVVAWGTREVKQKKSKAELEEEKKQIEEAKKKAGQGSIQNLLQSFTKSSKKEHEGSIEFSLGNLLKCMLCTRSKTDSDMNSFAQMKDSMDKVAWRLENMERCMEGNLPLGRGRPRAGSRTSMDPSEGNHTAGSESVDEKKVELEVVTQQKDDEERDDLINPYWIEDKVFNKCEFTTLDTNEINFWKELISEYLAPLLEDKDKKEKISKELKELRDKMFVSFFMVNALFVTVVFILQLNKSKIFLNWPLDAKVNMTIDEHNEIHIHKTKLQLEPVGVVFIVFFAVILVIQFGAMFVHRFETLSHLLSNSSITIPWRKKKKTFEYNVQAGKREFRRKNKKDYKEHVKDYGLTPEKLEDVKEKADSIFSDMKDLQDQEMADKAEKRRSVFSKFVKNLSEVGSGSMPKLNEVPEDGTEL